jgi:hypothetical protein
MSAVQNREHSVALYVTALFLKRFALPADGAFKNPKYAAVNYADSCD